MKKQEEECSEKETEPYKNWNCCDLRSLTHLQDQFHFAGFSTCRRLMKLMTHETNDGGSALGADSSAMWGQECGPVEMAPGTYREFLLTKFCGGLAWAWHAEEAVQRD